MSKEQPKRIENDNAEEAHNSKLRGISELSIDAIHGITHIVESLHGVIQSKFLISNKQTPEHTTQGLTGFIYRNIRYMTSLIGSGIDKILENIENLVASDKSQNKISYSREALIAALNGVLGDHLLVRKNPLAIKMQFRFHGQTLTEDQVQEQIKASNGKVLLMIHGLCMNDLQWTKLDHNHGEELAKELGYTPIYLHYNSGLHVSENGQQLSDLLERIYQTYESKIELNILAHSMGGLLIRSACEDARLSEKSWLSSLKRVVFIGTPHHGAHLERLGNWVDSILSLSQYTQPFSKLGKIRSSGITDLRYGNLLATDWDHEDRFEPTGDQRSPVPLLKGIEYYAIAATSKKINPDNNGKLGDGLVTINSAFGRHKNPDFDLNMNKANLFVVDETSHMKLLSCNNVYTKIRKWFTH
jgi:pimeloyl-ACP methyl ester carboxylesterase